MRKKILQLRGSPMKVSLNLAVVSASFAYSTAVLPQALPDSLKKYEQEALPSVGPSPTLDTKIGIPLPRGTQMDASSVSVLAKPETEEERAALRSALDVANRSPQVQGLLAANARLLAGGALPPPLDMSPSEDRRYLFTYYNYKRERAVEVIVSQGQVLDTREREQGYQPPASAEEILAASEAVGPRLTANVRSDSLRGLAFSGPDGRRQLYIYGDSPSQSTSVTVVPASGQVMKFQSTQRNIK